MLIVLFENTALKYLSWLLSFIMPSLLSGLTCLTPTLALKETIFKTRNAITGFTVKWLPLYSSYTPSGFLPPTPGIHYLWFLVTPSRVSLHKIKYSLIRLFTENIANFAI